MKRPELLSQDEINEKLMEFSLWEQSKNTIYREIVAANFAASVGILNAIAVIAESLDHHPDILLYGWNKLKITTTTHDQGGLTELDFMLAQKIEDLKF